MTAGNQFEDLVRLISGAVTIDDTLRVVMDRIGVIFAPLNWSLMLRDARTGDLRFTTVTGSGAEKLRGRLIPRGQGVAGWIAENGQSVIIEDVTKDARFDRSMDVLSGFTTQSVIGVPLKTRNRVFGVIELINKLDGHPFTPIELRTLTTIADVAAMAIEKAYYLRALKRVATVDPLTGVYNRRSLFRFLEREKARTLRSRTPLSLLIVDIDHFKTVNDTLGHEAGDEILRSLARILLEGVRKVDLVCRYGGDVFVVIMPDTPAASAVEVKTRLLARLERHNADAKIRFSVSLGLDSAAGDDVDHIFRTADLSLYREKGGRDVENIENLPGNIQELMTDEEEDAGGRGGPG